MAWKIKRKTRIFQDFPEGMATLSYASLCYTPAVIIRSIHNALFVITGSVRSTYRQPEKWRSERLSHEQLQQRLIDTSHTDHTQMKVDIWTTHSYTAALLGSNKKSPANAKGNAQQRCMFKLWKPSKTKSVARGRQTTDGKLSIVFYLYSPEGATCLAQPTPYRLKIANFSHPLSFSMLVRGGALRIYGKALPILKLESTTQPIVKIWWS